MRSVSSSEVICSISIRWRNCGVRTSRCERLVVNLRDIPQIRLPFIATSAFGLSRLWPHGRDYNRSDVNKSSHAKLFTEIKPPHFRVFRQVMWLTRTKDLPFRHDVSTVSD